MSSELPYDPEMPDLDSEETGSDAEGVADPIDPDDCTEPTLCGYTEFVEGESVEDVPATGDGAEGLEASIWDVLYDIEDPEMPVSIVDLGLIYGVEVANDHDDDGDAAVQILMTLTYSGCPARTMLMDEITEEVANVDGVGDVDLRLVWSPEWTIEMVTEQGKEDLREFGLSV